MDTSSRAARVEQNGRLRLHHFCMRTAASRLRVCSFLRTEGTRRATMTDAACSSSRKIARNPRYVLQLLCITRAHRILSEERRRCALVARDIRTLARTTFDESENPMSVSKTRIRIFMRSTTQSASFEQVQTIQSVIWTSHRMNRRHAVKETLPKLGVGVGTPLFLKAPHFFIVQCNQDVAVVWARDSPVIAAR